MTQTVQVKDPKAPATPAQLNFLADLVKNRDLPEVCERATLAMTLGTLRKGPASDFISKLLAAPKKNVTANPAPVATKTFTVPAEPQLGPAAVLATLTELPAFGYYEINGTFYYWDVTGKDGFPTLRRLTVVINYDGSKKGKWGKVYAGYKSPKVTGTFTPYAGKGYHKTPVTKPVSVAPVLAEAVIAGAKVMSQAEAAAKGKAVGFCIRCGATLTDPVSVANGIGPVCAKYWA